MFKNKTLLVLNWVYNLNKWPMISIYHVVESHVQIIYLKKYILGDVITSSVLLTQFPGFTDIP